MTTGAGAASAATTTLDRAISEREWRDVVVSYAKLNGWLVYFTWRSDHSPAGFPDLICVRKDRCVAVELKREGKHATPSQLAWLSALADVPGVQPFVWRPSQWPEVRDCLL